MKGIKVLFARNEFLFSGEEVSKKWEEAFFAFLVLLVAGKKITFGTQGTLKPALSARVFFSYSPIDNELIGKQ